VTRDYSTSEFLGAAADLDRMIDEQLAQVRARRQEHDGRVAEVRAQREEVLGQLTRHVLPDLSPATCQRAVTLTAFTDLTAIPPERRIAAERLQLEGEIAKAEADPTYAQREVRRVRATTELDEINEFQAPLVEVVNRAAHPRLDTLLDNGYDTDAYTGRWWRASYYADWKAGDEIVERFPTKASFSAVREEVLAARQAISDYAARITTLQQELAAIDEVERRHQAASDRLANLAELHLAEWRHKLALHIALIDPAGLADRFGGEPGAELLLKTLAGTGKKLEYLDQIATTQLDPFEQQLRAEQTKLKRDRIKYSRPKNAWLSFPGDRYEKRFVGRGNRWGKFWNRYDRTHSTIFVFDGYHRGSFYSDFLWWDLMTDGQIDGNFIPEVAEYYHHHPNYRWDRDRADDEQAAAAATAMADRADDDARSAVSGFDPS
jgi:hypothetical protein